MTAPQKESTQTETNEATEASGKQNWWKRRKRWQKVAIGAAGAVVVIAIGVNAGGGGTDSGVETGAPASDTPTAEAPPGDSGETVPGIGDEVRDGKFAFVVTGVESPGAEYNPDDSIVDEATGTWFIVGIDVTNIGDEEQTFSAGNQKLVWEGKELSATDFAWHGTNFEDVNPGLTVGATVMFDVPDTFPVDGSGATLVLHDSSLSGGVELGL